MKKSVYLSRSNAGDAESYRAVKSVLEKMDVDIIEHTGGPYDASLVTSAEYLIVIPPRRVRSCSYHPKSSERIGKGQNDQIDKFIQCNSSDNVLIVRCVYPMREEIDLSPFSWKNKVENNWTDNYSMVTTTSAEDVEYFFDRKKKLIKIKKDPLDLDLDAYSDEAKLDSVTSPSQTYEDFAEALRKSRANIPEGAVTEPAGTGWGEVLPNLEWKQTAIYGVSGDKSGVRQFNPQNKRKEYGSFANVNAEVEMCNALIKDATEDILNTSIASLKYKISVSLVKVSGETTRPMLALAA